MAIEPSSDGLSLSIIVFADGVVGKSCADWLIENFAGDIKMAVTLEENETNRNFKEKGIPTRVFSSDDQIAREVSSMNVPIDLGLLLWWPNIISRALFDLPKYGFLNTHPSLLPFGKGKNPNFWSLVNGEPFGVSLHRVEEKVDSGQVLAQREIPYSWEDNGGTLYERASREMVDLFIKSYPKLRSLQLSGVSLPPWTGPIRRQKEMEEASILDLEEMTSVRNLLNLLRARTFPGHPGCSFFEDGAEYEVTVNIVRKK